MNIIDLQVEKKWLSLRFFFLVLVLFSLPSTLAGQNPEVDRLQNEVDQSYGKDPALAVKKLKLLLEYREVLHDTVVAEIYGKLGKSMVQMARYDAAYKFFDTGIAGAKAYPGTRAKLLILLGITYRSTSRHEESLETLSEALRLYQERSDSIGIAKVYGEFASNYNYMLEPEKAISYLKKGIEILEQENEEVALTVLKQKLANSYFNNGNFQFAQSLYEEVLPEFSKTGGSNYFYTLMNYGDCLFYLENYHEAADSYAKAAKGLEKIGNRDMAYFVLAKQAQVAVILDMEKHAMALYDRAFRGLYTQKSPRLTQVISEYLKLLNQLQEYRKALDIIEKYSELKLMGLPLQQNYRDEQALLEQSLPVYKNTGKLNEALAVHERLAFLKDSVNQVRNEEKVVEIHEKYQNELQKEHNNVLESNIQVLNQDLERKNRLIILTALVLLLLIFCTYFFFHRMRYKDKVKRLQIEVLNAQKENLQTRHEEEERRLLEQEKIIEAKARELVASTMERSGIQQNIKQLLQEVSEPKDLERFKKRLLKILEEKNYWREFEARFVEVHPDFFEEWEKNYPALTKNDIQFCSLLKLGLTNKEIASLLGISHQSVITKKYRIKRKLEIANDEEFDSLFRPSA